MFLALFQFTFQRLLQITYCLWKDCCGIIEQYKCYESKLVQACGSPVHGLCLLALTGALYIMVCYCISHILRFWAYLPKYVVFFYDIYDSVCLLLVSFCQSVPPEFLQSFLKWEWLIHFKLLFQQKIMCSGWKAGVIKCAWLTWPLSRKPLSRVLWDVSALEPGLPRSSWTLHRTPAQALPGHHW